VSRSRHALTIQPGPRRRRSASAFSPDASTHPGSNEGGPQHGQPNTTLHVARFTSPATDLQRLHRIAELLATGVNLSGVAMVLDLQDTNARLRADL